VKDAGTGFAFPSQTAYLGRDTGIDAEASEVVAADSATRSMLSYAQLAREPQLDEISSADRVRLVARGLRAGPRILD
jgi:hypothetical protein